MSRKKKKKESEGATEEDLQERLKKEEELFQDLFGVTIEDATEQDIEDTLSNLEEIEKNIEISQKKKDEPKKPKKQDGDFIKQPTKPPTTVPKPKIMTPLPKIPKKPVPSIKKEVPPPSSLIIKREFDFVGGDVRFKIAVKNASNMIVSDINVTINPTTQFLTGDRVKSLNMLKPGESRGIDFTLTPLDCGTSKIYGTVSYIDYQGRPYSITIEPKEIQIKCPLVQPQPRHFSKDTVDKLKKNLHKSSWAIEFLGISAKQAHNLIREQIAALDVTEVFNDPDNFQTEWAGLAKVTGQQLIIVTFILENRINLEVYSQDIKQATGLLAYIKNIIKLAIDNAQKIGGTIEKIGIKILDSFEICKKSIQLASLCEIQTLINDIIPILKEIEAKLRLSFPETDVWQRLIVWSEVLSKNFDLDQNIDLRTATDLEYDIIQWLNKIKNITQANVKIYQETFSEYAKLGSIQEGLNALYKDIEELEQNYSMKILRYLIVVQKFTGLTVYREKLGSDVELDPFLVSGFLSAISSFGTELSKSKKETMMKKLAYEDWEINIEDGEHIRAALLLQGQGTIYLSNKLLEFVKEFEQKFSSNLINWNGNMSIFRPASEILKKIMPEIKIYPITEKGLEGKISASKTTPERPIKPTVPKPTIESPQKEKRFAEGAIGTLKVVAFPKAEEKVIKPKPIKVITPKPLFVAPKIQADEPTADLSEFRCSVCGARITKKDLDKIKMGFIIPCKECGGDLIGEAIKKI
ncbi:MAG: hypothetical protein ACTSO9_05520 [Candidatus Helarchaeota archaeon]